MSGIPSRLVWAMLLSVAVGSGCATSRHMAASPQGHWLAEDIGGGGVIDDLQTTLDIAGDGRVSGSGGCNRYGGKAEIDGSSIVIGPVAATKMACIPAPMDQETKFFDALDKARSWRIEDGKLLLLDGSGAILARFARMQSGAAITIPVPTAQAVDSTKATYACDDGSVIEIEYINAGTVSLATLSMKDEFVVAANVIAGSGARYAGNRFIWWTKGREASLYDLMKGADAPGIACHAG